jgi:hypothetical protein
VAVDGRPAAVGTAAAAAAAGLAYDAAVEVDHPHLLSRFYEYWNLYLFLERFQSGCASHIAHFEVYGVVRPGQQLTQAKMTVPSVGSDQQCIL